MHSLTTAAHAMDTATREREYSPSSCIGGHYQPFIAAYKVRSAAAREQAQALGGRWVEGRYGELPAQRLDICLPPPRAALGTGARELPVAALVFIHGGYWQELAAADSLFPAALCAQRGLAFVALDYTLAPQATVAGIVAECRAALAWLAANAAVLGLDARRFVVAGSSAGAHLAAMVCVPQGAKPGSAPGALSNTSWPTSPETLAVATDAAPSLRAAILVSGIYELEPLIGTSINEALGLDAAQAAANSPLRLPLRGFPPTLVCWGDNETAAFKAQSRAMAQALQAAGTPVTRFEVPGRNHFDVILDLADAGSELGRASAAFFLNRS
jgi:arylformamidase